MFENDMSFPLTWLSFQNLIPCHCILENRIWTSVIKKKKVPFFSKDFCYFNVIFSTILSFFPKRSLANPKQIVFLNKMLEFWKPHHFLSLKTNRFLFVKIMVVFLSNSCLKEWKWSWLFSSFFAIHEVVAWTMFDKKMRQWFWKNLDFFMLN